MIDAAVFVTLLQLASFAPPPVAAGSERPVTFEERVTAQRAIERVYWQHRIWPKENTGARPDADSLISDAALRERVHDDLRKSAALERWWGRPVTGAQMQAELDRMAKRSNDPRMLQELFEALGNDATLIAETLARQVLADRLVRSAYATDGRIHGELKRRATKALARC